MTLHRKLLWAQAPLVAALLVVAGLTGYAAHRFGAAPGAILHENFRSIEAGTTLLQTIETIETKGESPELSAAFLVALTQQQANITEPTEAEVTARLAAAWARRDLRAARPAAQQILQLNRDAMVRKSAAAHHEARQVALVLITSGLGALVLALAATAVAFRRTLAPLRVLARATRRLAQGDLDTRVRLRGGDELSALAEGFNELATHLAEYRQSSLGELRAANHQLQAVMDSLADAVVVYDTSGQATSRNQAAVDLLGDRPLPEGLAAAIDVVRASVQQTGQAVVTEALEDAVEVPAHPLPRHVVVGGTPVRAADGGLVATTVLLRDVSRLQKLEGFRGDLVATAAHELRTPLTALHMSVHLCLEGTAGPLTPTQADLLGAAREECERLQAVVSELLDLARLEAGTLDLHPVRVPVQSLLARAAERHEAQAHRLGTTVVVEPGDLLCEVYVDPTRFARVLDNLIDNALTHGQGPVVLRSGTHTLNEVWIEVDDHGPGVAAVDRERIFEKFYRAPGTQAPGSGLGLGLVRDLVRAHGGRVEVSATPAGGARFVVWLPTTRS